VSAVLFLGAGLIIKSFGWGGGGKKGGEKRRKKKEEEGGRKGEEEKCGESSGLHLNESLNQSQSGSCGMTSQTLQELGRVLRWWSVVRGSVIRLAQPVI